jgi:Domain of unknown function (DUF4160)
MYYGDHPPPHFHLTSRQGAMKMAIRGRRVLAGSLPPHMTREAVRWAAGNEDLLMAIWNRLNETEGRS